jgi:Uma2 family endonuclease
MAIPKLKRDKNYLYTVEEYLKFERASEERYSYFDGEISLMAGESDRHGEISVNLTGEIRSQLKGKKCRVRSKDAKIQTGGFKLDTKSKKGVFSYPDLLVVCGEVEYHDKHQDIILNPKVIIEVLSDTTELFDRSVKFTRYKMFNPTLNDYILVSQDKPMVEHFIRQDDKSWKVFTYLGLEETFKIESIECELKLSEIYDRVSFKKDVFDMIDEIKNG